MLVLSMRLFIWSLFIKLLPHPTPIIHTYNNVKDICSVRKIKFGEVCGPASYFD